ncbi:unnamed protein product [Brassica oleracea var. botrytis]|uniref:putative B3 domain-containing protein At4g03170 n=1 Tax=Brassica oleracea var. oleracea TaxID=109376 RepID=UPI0006A6F17F|nr:PREDICTED: putative B3 domain-containing protein At4g03170 [Brassica oleracea var. oleracea]
MASQTQDEEEVHHRKKEDALDEEPELIDLNIEAKHEDDDNIVASESSETREAKRQKVEQEVKDANQEDDDEKIVASESSATSQQEVKDSITMMVPSTTTPRSLTQEEAKAKEDDARASRMLASTSNDLVRPGLEINDYDVEDSEQTLTFLTRWKAPETPPEKIIHRSLVEQCSRPIQKQLTTSDVTQNKLSLSNSQARKKFQQLLGDESGRKESGFTVYGPDGKVHEIWVRKKKRSFDLTIGWWTFVEQYGLKECCDFVTVWMFRHSVTRRICLAVDVTRFAFRKQVSKRISQAAFHDSA